MKTKQTTKNTPLKCMCPVQPWAESTPVPLPGIPGATMSDLLDSAVRAGTGTVLALVESKLKKTSTEFSLCGRRFKATLTPLAQ